MEGGRAGGRTGVYFQLIEEINGGRECIVLRFWGDEQEPERLTSTERAIMSA